MAPTQMIRPKFYIGQRDTRWDVYPQQQPEEVIAHDWYGFWKKADDGRWYKTPMSFVLVREITEHEANAPAAPQSA